MGKATYIGGKLHPGQLKIVKDILSSNEIFYTIVTPRQFGKSFMCIQLMLYFALNNPKSKLMFTAPVYSQVAKVFKELVNGIKDSGVIKKMNAVENSIIFINDSEIFFKSLTIPDNIRGNTINYVFCDEASFYKEGVFDSVIIPLMSSVKNPKCFLFSTPRGKNYFYKFYNNGVSNVEGYKSYRGSSDDNPFRNNFIVEIAKKTMPDAIFRQEFLAEFIDDTGSVFQNLSKVATLTKWQDPIAGERYYAGIDIALSGDFLVLTILNSKGEIVHCYRDNKKAMSFMIEQIKIALNKYNPEVTYVETNGIGNGIFEYIQKTHRSVLPFNTSNKSKQDIIENLIFAFQEEEVKIPSKEFYSVYFDELSDFGFEYSPKTRKVIYNSISGHDDCVISLAIANHAKTSGISKGKYYIQ